MDAYGDHAASCMKNGVLNRHTVMQDWLLSTARKAGVPCTKEAALPDGDRPGDVLFNHWTGGSPLAIDLTIVHPLRLSETRPTPEAMRKSLDTQEAAKCKKYTTRCAAVGWAFQPLPFNTFGGTTAKGAQVLHRLSRLYADNTTSKHTRGERVALFWQGLQVTLLTQIAGQLRTSTYTGPQGPVLPIYYPTDSWGNLIPTSSASQPAKRPRVVRPNRVDGQHQPYPHSVA